DLLLRGSALGDGIHVHLRSHGIPAIRADDAGRDDTGDRVGAPDVLGLRPHRPVVAAAPRIRSNHPAVGEPLHPGVLWSRRDRRYPRAGFDKIRLGGWVMGYRLASQELIYTFRRTSDAPCAVGHR